MYHALNFVSTPTVWCRPSTLKEHSRSLLVLLLSFISTIP